MELKSIKAEAAACRATFAGSKVGDLAWNVHHDVLCEPLTEPAENRIEFILEQKPVSERARRLHNMRPVKGKLPDKVAAARAKWDAARAEWDVADAKWDAAEAKWNAACAEWDAADAKWDAARAKWDAARAKWFAAHVKLDAVCGSPEMLALHAREMPDSTWNGKSIFPE